MQRRRGALSKCLTIIATHTEHITLFSSAILFIIVILVDRTRAWQWPRNKIQKMPSLSPWFVILIVIIIITIGICLVFFKINNQAQKSPEAKFAEWQHWKSCGLKSSFQLVHTSIRTHFNQSLCNCLILHGLHWLRKCYQWWWRWWWLIKLWVLLMVAVMIITILAMTVSCIIHDVNNLQQNLTKGVIGQWI